jgi:hypothetical protein
MLANAVIFAVNKIVAQHSLFKTSVHPVGQASSNPLI